MGGFSLSITMLNIPQRSPLTDVYPFDEGGFGRVYTISHPEGKVVIKFTKL
jgi:hypothetical protein